MYEIMVKCLTHWQYIVVKRKRLISSHHTERGVAFIDYSMNYYPIGMIRFCFKPYLFLLIYWQFISRGQEIFSFIFVLSDFTLHTQNHTCLFSSMPIFLNKEIRKIENFSINHFEFNTMAHPCLLWYTHTIEIWAKTTNL